MENNELENINGVNVSNDTDEMSKRLNKIRNTDFSIVIKILFYLMMITSGIRSVINVFSGYAYYRLSQADSQFSLWENSFALSLVNMFGTIINIVGIILILKRKIVGFILLVVVTVFLPIITECLGIDVASTIILGLIRLAVISLVLLIRNDGISGWAIITATDKDSDQINPDTPSADNIPTIIEEQKDVEEDSALTPEKVDEIDDKSIVEIVDNQDSITNESDKIPVENQEESHSNEVEISQEVEPTEDNNVEVKPNETKPKKRMKPQIIILLVLSFAFIVGVISFFLVISSQQYPLVVESMRDKILYHYEIPNTKLAEKIIEKAQNAKLEGNQSSYKKYLFDIKKVDKNNIIAAYDLGEYDLENIDVTEGIKYLEMLTSDDSMRVLSHSYYLLTLAYYKLERICHDGKNIERINLNAMKTHESNPLHYEGYLAMSIAFYVNGDYRSTVCWSKTFIDKTLESNYPLYWVEWACYTVAECYYKLLLMR